MASCCSLRIFGVFLNPRKEAQTVSVGPAPTSSTAQPAPVAGRMETRPWDRQIRQGKLVCRRLSFRFLCLSPFPLHGPEPSLRKPVELQKRNETKRNETKRHRTKRAPCRSLLRLGSGRTDGAVIACIISGVRRPLPSCSALIASALACPSFSILSCMSMSCGRTILPGRHSVVLLFFLGLVLRLAFCLPRVPDARIPKLVLCSYP